MIRWRLDGLLRLRSDAEDRAAGAYASAARSLHAQEAAAAAAVDAWRAAAGQLEAPGAAIPAGLLRASALRLRRLEADARAALSSREAARPPVEWARQALLRAARDRRALELLRDRDRERRRRARDASEEEEIADAAAPTAPRARHPGKP